MYFLSPRAQNQVHLYLPARLFFSRRVNPSHAHGKHGQPRAILGSCLVINRAQIIPHRLLCQTQFVCNLAIRVSLRDQNHDLFFRVVLTTATLSLRGCVCSMRTVKMWGFCDVGATGGSEIKKAGAKLLPLFLSKTISVR
jgi:hypothetical protein